MTRQCVVCDYIWEPILYQPAKRCDNCGSRYWKRPLEILNNEEPETLTDPYKMLADLETYMNQKFAELDKRNVILDKEIKFLKKQTEVFKNSLSD